MGKRDHSLRLARAAEIEFSSHGLAGASIESIAQRAAVSRQYIYRKYRSKLELYQDIRCSAEQTLLPALTGINLCGDAITELSDFIDRLWDVHKSCPLLGAMLADQAIHGTKPFRRSDQLSRRFQQVWSELNTILDTGRKDGRVLRQWDGRFFYFLVSSLILSSVAQAQESPVDQVWIKGFALRALSTATVACHNRPAFKGAFEGDESSTHRILTVAEAEFASQGFGVASLVEIAKIANVSESLIYHYFENKAGLYRAVQDRLVDRYLSVFEKIKIERLEPLDFIEIYVKTYRALQLENPSAVALALSARFHHGNMEGGNAATQTRRRRLLQRIEWLLDRGRSAKLIHSNMTAQTLYFATAAVFSAGAALGVAPSIGVCVKTYSPWRIDDQILREAIIQGSVGISAD